MTIGDGYEPRENFFLHGQTHVSSRRMADTSIALLWGLLIGAVAIASMVAAYRVFLPRTPRTAEPEIDRAELLRLRLAQHWARGGLLSDESEAWRPACMAIAIAALGCRDMSELGVILRTQIGAMSAHDPQVSNIFRQALAEYIATDTGKTLDPPNSGDWPHESLIHRVRELLEGATEKAARITDARNSARPPAPET